MPDDAHSDAEARLEAMNAQLEQLANGMAHDLRAPLRSIDSYAELLAQHAGDALDATSQGYLQRIRDASRRLGALVDALQEYSYAGRTPMRPSEAVDLSLLADWVAADMQDAEPGREARIDVMPGMSVPGDETLLRQMLQKLLGNAWKFSAPRDRVEIRVYGEREGDLFRLHVEDRGVGFDMDYVDKLFQPFQKLHGIDEGAGSGMGLATAQCIARRHGGRIRAESRPGAGSTFHVDLPATAGQGGLA